MDDLVADQYAAMLEIHHLEFLDACRKVIAEALLAKNLPAFAYADIADIAIKALDDAGYLT